MEEPEGGGLGVTATSVTGSTPIEHLRQQLSAMEEECRQKDKVIREKVEVLKEKDEVIREKDEVIREKSVTIREQQSKIQRLRDQPAVSLKVS